MRQTGPGSEGLQSPFGARHSLITHPSPHPSSHPDLLDKHLSPQRPQPPPWVVIAHRARNCRPIVATRRPVPITEGVCLLSCLHTWYSPHLYIQLLCEPTCRATPGSPTSAHHLARAASLARANGDAHKAPTHPQAGVLAYARHRQSPARSPSLGVERRASGPRPGKTFHGRMEPHHPRAPYRTQPTHTASRGWRLLARKKIQGNGYERGQRRSKPTEKRNATEREGGVAQRPAPLSARLANGRRRPGLSKELASMSCCVAPARCV